MEGMMSCYVIAEAGVAHEGSLETARTLLRTAHEAGADAFKIQHFENKGFDGMKRRDGTPLPVMKNDDILELSRDCRARGLDFIITPHDEWALDFIDSSDICDRLKIGSGDWHLIYRSRRFGPDKIIISTGMHTDEEICSMMSDLPRASFLHCISEYPTTPASSCLWYMRKIMRDYPSHRIGYSDHTPGIAICISAVALGAKIIEKHLTVEKRVLGKLDTYVSLQSEDFIRFVQNIRAVELSLRQPSTRVISLEEQKTKDWVMKSRGLTLDTWR